MTEDKPYAGMLGYADNERSYVWSNVDRHDAKAARETFDLAAYLLIPEPDNENAYSAWRRYAPGKYVQMPVRIFLFRYILNHENTRIPTDEELKTGKWSG
jgi:hypothetical protein